MDIEGSLAHKVIVTGETMGSTLKNPDGLTLDVLVQLNVTKLIAFTLT